MTDSKLKLLYDQIKEDILTTTISTATIGSDNRETQFPTASIEFGGGDTNSDVNNVIDWNGGCYIRVKGDDRNQVEYAAQEIMILWKGNGNTKMGVLRGLDCILIDPVGMVPPMIKVGTTTMPVYADLQFQMTVRYSY
jgi:hypothetical protein